MGHLLRRFPLGIVVPVAVGTTIFLFACGSSSVDAVARAGRPLRWVALFVLLGLAVAYAASRMDRARLSARTIWPAAALVALALASSAWSVAPGLTAARAVSLGVLFSAAGALALASAGRREAIAGILRGILGGATAVALAGLVVLALGYDDAVQAASTEFPARYQGLGENPNTVSLLLALALPLAGWLALSRPWYGGALLALFAGSMIVAGSRASLLAGFGGLLALALLAGQTARARAVLGAGAVIFAAASIALSQLPDALPLPSAGAAPPSATSQRYVDAERAFPLDEDLGRPLPGEAAPPVRRRFLGGSGRLEAWKGALEETVDRPAVGYGFGTESRVFVDRFFAFVGGLPENTYLGTLLQLGGVGLALLALALLAPLVLAIRLALRAESLAAACAAVLLAALLVGGVQSYLTSVGNIAAASAWLCAFLVPAVAELRPEAA